MRSKLCSDLAQTTGRLGRSPGCRVRRAGGGHPTEQWTVPELKGYAEAHAIDLEGATKKADILAKINGSHQHTTAWLWGKVFDSVVARGIPIITPTTNQRMQYATGKGNAQTAESAGSVTTVLMLA